MNIYSVIVDRECKACISCPFARRILDEQDRFADYWYICSATGRLMTDKEYIHKRPDWCPLMTLDALPFVETVDYEWVDGRLVKTEGREQ